MDRSEEERLMNGLKDVFLLEQITQPRFLGWKTDASQRNWFHEME